MAQSPEVTELRKRAMVQVASLGCTRIAAVVDAGVYSMQFKRIASESRVTSSVFKDVSSALEWLRGQQIGLPIGGTAERLSDPRQDKRR